MLGIACIAVCALSCVFAAGAQAGEYTGEEAGKNVKTVMDGIAWSNQVFQVGSYKTTCTGFSGSDEFATGKSKTLATKQATYSDCSTKSATDTTVTMNGCEHKFGEPQKAAKDYTISTAKFACPAKKHVEIHVYTDKTHTTSLCTLTTYPKVAAEEEEPEVVEEEEEGEFTGENVEGGGGTPKTFVINMNVKNLFYVEHGVNCADAKGQELQGATFTGSMLWRATNATGTAIDALMSG
jgi:hypothetical protein